jgi:AraC-like DNA-binding protein
LQEYIYSPHYDFYINKVHRVPSFDMKTFHLHKKYEIYYLLEGTRKYFIEDSVYLVNAGNIVIIDKDEVHKTGAVENAPHTRFVLNFNPEYIGPILDSVNGCDLLSFFSMGIKVLAISMKEQGLFENILQRMYNLVGNGTPDAEIMRKALLTELLVCLKECVGAQQNENVSCKKLNNKTIDKISDYITSNYREALSLNQIASQFFISPCYLSHLFKKTTNLTIVEYINSVRIRVAKNYLETTDMNITEIAEQAGFSTSSHFSRMFKLGSGLSPNQYRKYYHKT